jgi:hypothetical protein
MRIPKRSKDHNSRPSWGPWALGKTAEKTLVTASQEAGIGGVSSGVSTS